MRPTLFVGWVMASILTLSVWPEAASGDARRVRSATAGTWVVDPDQPGPNLPPTGRSLFDLLFVKQTGDGPVYDLPFPFTRLLERIEAPLRGEGSRQPILKKALIPFGRSLQRHTAAPEYFKYPRMVVAVDTEPLTYSDAQPPIMLKDRLFLGYQEKSGVIEIISYNERAARFEFQVVTDYRADRTPRVTYAQRAICTSCHQNGAPLFAEAGWDETNTNSRIAEALAEEREFFYGIMVDRCCAVSPVAIDNATDRANLFSAYQLLWHDGCRDPESASFSARCRGAAFTAMLQHRLSAYSHFDTSADSYREYFRPLFTRNWRRNWPGGLNIPNPNIPNRKPLLSPRPTYISAELDPLKHRSPLAVWQVRETRDRQRMITGFAEFLPAVDIKRLDTYIYDRAVREDAERQRLTRVCPVTRQDLLGGAELLVVRCEDEPATAAGPFELLADLVTDGDGGMRGSLVRLELAHGELFTNLQLAGTRVLRRGQTKRARLDVLQRRYQTRVRTADGNAIAVFDLHWPDAAGERKLDARVTLEIIGDFAPVHAAIARLADDDDSMLSSTEPFHGTRAMQELLTTLGLAPTPWCCDELPAMPPVRIADDGEFTTHPSLQSSADTGVPAGFYDRCGSCHGGDTVMPPGFMHGTPRTVAANLSQCAERIYVRLGMWQVREDARAKSPMPPVLSVASASGLWQVGEEYHRMLDYLGGVLKARRGARPSLDDLVARGYENLRDCLPEPTTTGAALRPR